MVERYEIYSERGTKFRKLPLVDGTCRTVSVRKIVGYCRYDLHKGYLDVNLLQKHDCIRKQCQFLHRYDDYPFWVKYNNKEKIRAEQKQRSMEKKKKIEKITSQSNEKMKQLEEKFQETADKLGYDIVIVKIFPKEQNEKNYKYIVNYVSDNLYDDWSLYFDITLIVSKCFGGIYILKHVKNQNGDYISIDDWKKLKK